MSWCPDFEFRGTSARRFEICKDRALLGHSSGAERGGRSGSRPLSSLTAVRRVPLLASHNSGGQQPPALRGPEHQFGAPVSGWPQQLVSRLGVSDHTPLRLGLVQPECLDPVLHVILFHLLESHPRVSASASTTRSKRKQHGEKRRVRRNGMEGHRRWAPARIRTLERPG